MQKASVNSTQLLDLKRKIKTLEEAIKETEKTKTKLQRNVQEVGILNLYVLYCSTPVKNIKLEVI